MLPIHLSSHLHSSSLLRYDGGFGSLMPLDILVCSFLVNVLGKQKSSTVVQTCQTSSGDFFEKWGVVSVGNVQKGRLEDLGS